MLNEQGNHCCAQTWFLKGRNVLTGFSRPPGACFSHRFSSPFSKKVFFLVRLKDNHLENPHFLKSVWGAAPAGLHPAGPRRRCRPEPPPAGHPLPTARGGQGLASHPSPPPRQSCPQSFLGWGWQRVPCSQPSPHRASVLLSEWNHHWHNVPCQGVF